MDKTLKQLANDPHFSDFKEFQLSVIKDEAGEMALRGESTQWAKDAAHFIEKTFSTLQELYERKEPATPPINEAR